MKILITGSNGLLGQHVVDLCIEREIEFIATSSGVNRNSKCPIENYCSMDISNKEEVESVFSSSKPTHVIHTAAITNVDYCELNPEECELINVTASKLLFDLCKSQSLHFQFLSTDFVFDGIKGNYSEADQTNPLSVYAKSKDKAEQYLIDSTYVNWSIVRTIIVYGQGENLSRSNIIHWAKETLQAGGEMNIIDDQFRAPTFVNDLAWACVEIVSKNKNGIYHISGPVTYSIFEIVEKVAGHYGLSMKSVRKISSDTLNQPAKRPPRTGFNLEKAKNNLGYQPKTIEESLDIIYK